MGAEKELTLRKRARDVLGEKLIVMKREKAVYKKGGWRTSLKEG